MRMLLMWQIVHDENDVRIPSRSLRYDAINMSALIDETRGRIE
jgi:hypothetical protein